jgi:hypothetical protein
MTNEIVLTTTEMIGKDVKNALFWKSEHRYHEDEVTQEMLNNGKQWFRYYVRFNGLRPIQLTKSEKLRKPLQAK